MAEDSPHCRAPYLQGPRPAAGNTREWERVHVFLTSCVPTCAHACIYTHIQRHSMYLHIIRITGLRKCISSHMYSHASYIHTYIHTYIHAYIHTHIQTDRQRDR